MVQVPSIRKNKCKKCKKQRATSLIRGKEVCNSCFDVINRDNYKRMRLGKLIPRDFKLLEPN